jgi:GGDEF domain-containing protein
MVTAVVAACVTLVACGLTLLVVHRSRRVAELRLQVVLDRIDTHLAAVSASVESAVARVVDAQSRRIPQPTLDFAELVETIAAEAAGRTGADAVVVEVEGPGGTPVVASVGPGAHAGSELLHGTIAPRMSTGYRSATIEWAFEKSDDAADRFATAVVAPTGRATGIPGVIVAFADARGRLQAEHGAALHDLLVEYRSALANARRFADVEARLQPLRESAVAGEQRYADELEREVGRAHASGRSLSIVLVGLTSGTATATTDGVANRVERLAQVVEGATRRGDITCRSGGSEVAVLLPGTSGAGASILTDRLREEVSRSFAGNTLTVGHVEWRPEETARELSARLAALTGRPRPASPPVAATAGDEALRHDALAAVATEVERARRGGDRGVAVVVLDVEGQDDQPPALEPLAERFVDAVGSGSVHRLGSARFALLLPATDVEQAEAIVDSLDALAHELVVSAGITELVERDDADSLLGRAEHALWQARQAGRGTVVVAVPGRRTPPSA